MTGPAFGVLVAVLVVLAAVLLRRRLRSWQDAVRSEVAARLASEAVLADREAFLTALLESMDVEVVVVDPHGVPVLWNRAARAGHQVSGDVPDSEIGQWADEFSVRRPDGTALTTAELPIVRALAGEHVLAEECVMSAGGVERRLSINARPVRLPDGTPAGAICTGADISRLHRREAELARLNQDLVAVTRATELVLAGDDARTAVVDAARQVADAVSVMLFEPSLDAGVVLTAVAQTGTTLPVAEIRDDEDAHTLRAFRTGRTQVVPDVDAAGLRSPLVQRVQDATQDGPTLRALVAVPLLEAGVPRGVLTVGLAQPVAAGDVRLLGLLEVLAINAALALAREDASRKLLELSVTDPLTGVANRRRWQDRLDEELVRAARTGSPLNVVVLDLDRFKAYNDTRGHASGDALLVAATRAWTTVLRAGDTLARLGGEEFGVLLPACATDDAAALVDLLLAAVPDGQTCSAGVAQWTPGQTASQVTSRADAALYRAKTDGRARQRHAPLELPVQARRTGDPDGRTGRALPRQQTRP